MENNKATAKNIYIDSIRKLKEYKDMVYGEGDIIKMVEDFGSMMESLESHTLQETDGMLDKVSVNRDMKEMKNEFKILEKAAREVAEKRATLQHAYENIGTKLIMAAYRYKKQQK